MKRNRAKLCFLISVAFAVGFLLKTALDYVIYSNTLNSAPFWLWILVNAVYFLIPALIALICGLLFKRK